MNRTRAGRRAAPLPWTATLIAPIALVVVAVFGSRTDVAHLADAAQAADLAVRDALEPLRADGHGDHR